MNLPAYRVDQLVQAYGFTKEDFHKILGKEPAVNLNDDCHSMIDQMGEAQLVAVHSVMVLLFSPKGNPSRKVGEA